MSTHVSAEQVRWWLDENAIQDVTPHSTEETEFNLRVTHSRLPVHLIPGEKRGPVRVVGRSAFDTERARHLLRDAESRTELLDQIGPVLATTPGFYMFLEEDDRACDLRHVETLQLAHRLYPDEASQQALLDGVMAIATGMRYVQNVVAASRPASPSDADERKDVDG